MTCESPLCYILYRTYSASEQKKTLLEKETSKYPLGRKSLPLGTWQEGLEDMTAPAESSSIRVCTLCVRQDGWKPSPKTFRK